MRPSILCLALALSALVPAARADAIPPPEEHTALQTKLMGMWQGQECLRTKFRAGHACLRRIIGFGETSFSVLSAWSGRPNSYSTTAEQSSWTEVSSMAGVAVIKTSVQDGTEMHLKFDGETLTILGNDRYEDAHFKRLTPPVE